MTTGPAPSAAGCASCGSPLRPSAPFCSACGQPVTHRHPPAATPTGPHQPSAPATIDQVLPAGRGVRCCAALLDLAAMLSPVLPLAAAAAVLGVADVVYLVTPAAALAVWTWMRLWQGYSGATFGGALLGLRCVRTTDHAAPGIGPSLLRGLVFAGTAGMAALPVVLSDTPAEGAHDRLSHTTLVDIARGANPLGPRQRTTLRRSVDRSLRTVQSPVPFGAGGHR